MNTDKNDAIEDNKKKVIQVISKFNTEYEREYMSQGITLSRYSSFLFKTVYFVLKITQPIENKSWRLFSALAIGRGLCNYYESRDLGRLGHQERVDNATQEIVLHGIKSDNIIPFKEAKKLYSAQWFTMNEKFNNRIKVRQLREKEMHSYEEALLNRSHAYSLDRPELPYELVYPIMNYALPDREKGFEISLEEILSIQRSLNYVENPTEKDVFLVEYDKRETNQHITIKNSLLRKLLALTFPLVYSKNGLSLTQPLCF